MKDHHQRRRAVASVDRCETFITGLRLTSSQHKSCIKRWPTGWANRNHARTHTYIYGIYTLKVKKHQSGFAHRGQKQHVLRNNSRDSEMPGRIDLVLTDWVSLCFSEKVVSFFRVCEYIIQYDTFFTKYSRYGRVAGVQQGVVLRT